MTAIVIKHKSKSDLKILSELALKLGGEVISITENEMEDFALGKMMDKVKTGKSISREKIMKKLHSK